MRQRRHARDRAPRWTALAGRVLVLMALAPLPADDVARAQATAGPAPEMPADAFQAGPGLWIAPAEGRVFDAEGETVAAIGADWTHEKLDAITLKYALLGALGNRVDGRVGASVAGGDRRRLDGEIVEVTFRAARRGDALLLGLDAAGRLWRIRPPEPIAPGEIRSISLKVSPIFGEDHLLFVVGHAIDALSDAAAARQGEPIDATTVVELLSTLGDGSLVTLAIRTAAGPGSE
ncbi:MAG: hypothetical protein AAFV86_18905 [Pseudomonadota bacterium]